MPIEWQDGDGLVNGVLRWQVKEGRCGRFQVMHIARLDPARAQEHALIVGTSESLRSGQEMAERREGGA